MNRRLIATPRFRRSYSRLQKLQQQLVDAAIVGLEEYLRTRRAPVGLGVKKLGGGIFEARVNRSLRIIYLDEGTEITLAVLGSHDEVRRFLKSL